MHKETDVLDHEQVVVKKRTQFLAVICVLTFVGSGLGLLGAIWGLVPSTVQTGLDSMEELQKSPDTLINIGEFDKANYIKWSFYSNLTGIFSSLLCLGGALLMFFINKSGYFLYIAGWLLQISITIIATPHLLTGDLAGAGTISIVFNVLIMIAFIVMYSLNYKHMK